MKNKKGFTLIELLAVITIMGILMLVAIPAVSRTIENSRRSTFANTIGTYIRAASAAIEAGEVYCLNTNESYDTIYNNESNWIKTTKLNDNTYYYINVTTDQNYSGWNNKFAYENYSALLESGGKSSWGNSDLKGYLMFNITGSGSNQKIKFGAYIRDKGGHGVNAWFNNNAPSKNNVGDYGGTYTDDWFQPTYCCKIKSN